MKKIHLELISPTGIIFDGDVSYIKAPGTVGEFGILHNHCPFFTSLKLGIVEIEHFTGKETGGERDYYAVSGGFMEVADNDVVILAETAVLGKNIDPEKLKEVEVTASYLIEHGKSQDSIEKAKDLILNTQNKLKAYNMYKNLK